MRNHAGDRLRDCTTENIHTRNTLVIGFRLAILQYGYGIPYFCIFSERELMFTFAICRRPSVCLSVRRL